MNKEEFIGKLQMVYVGDRNAIEEIISEYDRLNNIIDKLEKELDLNLQFKVIGVRRLKDKLNELRGDNK